MLSSQIKEEAKASLSGKWGKAALMVLIYFLIEFAITFVLGIFSAIPFIGLIASIAQYVISLPLAYGFIASLMKLKRDEEVSYTDFLNIGFSAFGKVWSVFFSTLLKMLPGVIGIIVSIIILVVGGVSLSMYSYVGSSSSSGFSAIIAVIGFIGYIASLIYLIVKGFSFSLTNYLIYDEPELTSKEIVEKSERLMHGNKWNLFWLGLTFIGWIILTPFTLYIGLLWLFPYIAISMIVFYENLAGTRSDSNIVDNVENIPNETVIETKEEEIPEKDNSDDNPIQEN